MKILLICSSDHLAVPAAISLLQRNMLTAVVIPERYDQQLRPSFIQTGIKNEIIHAVAKKELDTALTSLIRNQNADIVFAISFPWKIPSSILTLPPYGCFNFHPGLLPKYKGADPIFWQLKNGESDSGITVHKMTETIDEGPVLAVYPMQLIQGEPYGLYAQRIGSAIAGFIPDVIEKINTGSTDEPLLSKTTATSEYWQKPDQLKTAIDWQTQSATEIEALVNACNPKYGGAYTTLNNMPISVLEVTPADLGTTVRYTPGTIAYADHVYGIITACKDQQFLKINVVHSSAGYLSGNKLFQLGFKTGDMFN